VQLGKATVAMAALLGVPLSICGRFPLYRRQNNTPFVHAGLGVEKDSTTLALERCHRTVLQPMRLILCLLAWQPFGLVSSRFRMKKALNLFYFLLILALVCSHYAIDLVLCQFEAHCVEGLECRAVMRHALPDLVHLCAFINAFVFFRYRQSGLDQIEVCVQAPSTRLARV
jgi:hypothetical protein